MAWIARTDYGLLYLFENKPIRNKKINSWDVTSGYQLFVEPNFDTICINRKITWEDEPVEIEVKIKES